MISTAIPSPKRKITVTPRTAEPPPCCSQSSSSIILLLPSHYLPQYPYIPATHPPQHAVTLLEPSHSTSAVQPYQSNSATLSTEVSCQVCRKPANLPPNRLTAVSTHIFFWAFWKWDGDKLSTYSVFCLTCEPCNEFVFSVGVDSYVNMPEGGKCC